MNIEFHLENGNEKMTNFRIAEAIINLCNDTHPTCNELDAEVVAKMILLQIDNMKEMRGGNDL